MFSKYKRIIFYGLVLAALVFLLKFLQWKFIILDNALEIYIGLIALLFTVLGVWLAHQLIKPKIEKVVVEKHILIQSDEDIQLLPDVDHSLSPRELEVLQLLANGHSNGDIAEELFVSLSTVKSHVSNIYSKLEVKRRTQAIQKGKKLGLVR